MLKKGKRIHMTTVLEKCEYKTFEIIRSFANFIYIKLRPCLDNYKSYKTIELVGAAKHTFQIL